MKIADMRDMCRVLQIINAVEESTRPGTVVAIQDPVAAHA